MHPIKLVIVFNLIYWTSLCSKFLVGTVWKMWKNMQFFRVDMTGLVGYYTGSYGWIGGGDKLFILFILFPSLFQNHLSRAHGKGQKMSYLHGISMVFATIYFTSEFHRNSRKE